MIRTSRGVRRRHNRGGHSVLEAAGGGHSAREADRLRLSSREYGEPGPRVLVQDILRSGRCRKGVPRVHPVPLAPMGALGGGRVLGLAPVTVHVVSAIVPTGVPRVPVMP